MPGVSATLWVCSPGLLGAADAGEQLGGFRDGLAVHDDQFGVVQCGVHELDAAGRVEVAERFLRRPTGPRRRRPARVRGSRCSPLADGLLARVYGEGLGQGISTADGGEARGE